MTTATVAKTVSKTATSRLTLEDLKGVKHAIEDWVRRARVNRENSKIEDWNMTHAAMLESRSAGSSSYFLS